VRDKRQHDREENDRCDAGVQHFSVATPAGAYSADAGDKVRRQPEPERLRVVAAE
jgi:hypothetical protein